MIATKKNFCVSISFVLQRCQPPPPLPTKKTPEHVCLPLGNPRHLSISATLVFPSQGMPRVAALPPIFWLPLLSAVCAQLNNAQEVEDNACIQVLPLVASESVQSSSSFHFNGSLIFHSIAKILVKLWGLGKGDVLKDGCRGSPFSILTLVYSVWRSCGQLCISSPFLDSLFLQTKSSCPDAPEVQDEHSLWDTLTH